jgi:hypothetical protein
VTDPFITGFQYSRPLQGTTISYGPLENKDLQYYYHPDATKGFSKRLDLYSLGIVLCEIGSWGLVMDWIPEDKKFKLQSREWSRDYMMNSVLEDLGWRMGKQHQSAVRTLLACRLPTDDDADLFAQQFYEKVLKPLDVCTA